MASSTHCALGCVVQTWRESGNGWAGRRPTGLKSFGVVSPNKVSASLPQWPGFLERLPLTSYFTGSFFHTREFQWWKCHAYPILKNIHKLIPGMERNFFSLDSMRNLLKELWTPNLKKKKKPNDFIFFFLFWKESSKYFHFFPVWNGNHHPHHLTYLTQGHFTLDRCCLEFKYCFWKLEKPDFVRR